MDMILVPVVNMTPILPEIFLSVLAMALLLINVFSPGGNKSYLAYFSFFGIVAAALIFVRFSTGFLIQTYPAH